MARLDFGRPGGLGVGLDFGRPGSLGVGLEFGRLGGLGVGLWQLLAPVLEQEISAVGR